MARSTVATLEPDVFAPEPVPLPPRPGLGSRVEALQATLMEELDDSHRGEIHVELGKIALKDGRIEAAARHFQEALELDPRLEAARRWLQDLGQAEPPRPQRGGLRSLLSRVFTR